MSLLERMKKTSTIKEADILSESKFFNAKDHISTDIPALNIALSADLSGGFVPGLTMWAGPSKHFKTCFSLLMAKAYLDKYPDAVLMFYDTEFGTPQGYFDAFGIDTTRVLHVPVTDVEQLKFDCTKQLNEITREEKVIIVIDSVGNLASKKEVEDALNEKSVADMSRAKQLKSFFRIVTPYLVMKDIPMVVVNHTYKEIGLYPKDIVGGGCLVAGTKIQMEDGSMQDIEKISIGDKVRVIDGVEEVTAIWDPNTLDDGTPECFEIEFEDGYKVICSDKHKFLVDDEWVEAKDLTINMNLSVL